MKSSIRNLRLIEHWKPIEKKPQQPNLQKQRILKVWKKIKE
ncbi:hypothetical protein [Fusobacterium necrophorum]|nr:hypothetical protein [Fusobacterium necrophorum]